MNEAMNFNLPVVVSRTAGCAEDLVTSESGLTFDEGSIEQLSDAIVKCRHASATLAPRQVVDGYSFEKIREALTSIQ